MARKISVFILATCCLFGFVGSASAATTLFYDGISAGEEDAEFGVAAWSINTTAARTISLQPLPRTVSGYFLNYSKILVMGVGNSSALLDPNVEAVELDFSLVLSADIIICALDHAPSELGWYDEIQCRINAANGSGAIYTQQMTPQRFIQLQKADGSPMMVHSQVMGSYEMFPIRLLELNFSNTLIPSVANDSRTYYASVVFSMQGSLSNPDPMVGLIGTYDVSNLYHPTENPNGYQVGHYMVPTYQWDIPLSIRLDRPDLDIDMSGLLAQQWGRRTFSGGSCRTSLYPFPFSKCLLSIHSLEAVAPCRVGEVC